MKAPLTPTLCLPALAGLFAAGCQSPHPPSPNPAGVPLGPPPEPPPAWTAAAAGARGGAGAGEDVRKVKIETKFIELVRPAGADDLPGERYERRLDGAGREAYLASLMERPEADLLSAPHVVAAEGQVANIVVGQTLTYPADPQDPLVMKEELIGVSSHFRARPSVEAGRIDLDVFAEVKEFKGFNERAPGAYRPVVETRQAGGSVRLADGETIVFGGLLTPEDLVVVDQVPFLGAIPLLGRAFRNKEIVHYQRELIVMVTPERLGP